MDLRFLTTGGEEDLLVEMAGLFSCKLLVGS